MQAPPDQRQHTPTGAPLGQRGSKTQSCAKLCVTRISTVLSMRERKTVE